MRKFLITSWLIVSLFPLAADTDHSVRVPTKEGTRAFFGMRDYLRNWENNPKKLTSERFGTIYEKYADSDFLEGILFENFLLETTNPAILDTVRTYIDTNDTGKRFTPFLKKHLDSKPTTQISRTDQKARSSYQDTEFDEHIDYFNFSESATFGGKLGFIQFANSWTSILFNAGSEPQSNNAVPKDSHWLLTGGGTNALTLRYSRTQSVPIENLEQSLGQIYYQGKFGKNFLTIDLPIVGELARSGADKVVMVYGTGPDLIPEIECGSFSIFLHSAKTGDVYELNYFLNFSRSNMYFDRRERLYDFMKLALLYTFIED